MQLVDPSLHLQRQHQLTVIQPIDLPNKETQLKGTFGIVKTEMKLEMNHNTILKRNQNTNKS